MDLLHPITALPLRSVQPTQAGDRGPRAVTASGQGFGAAMTGDRQADEPAPHGAPSRPMFFSLLSDSTLGVLRQMVFRGLSYRIDGSGAGQGAATGRKSGADDTAAQAKAPGAATTTESFSFSFTLEGQTAGAALQGMMRRATAAYAQAFAASPAFPFARPAETLNMVA
ncbi:hypothetical protein ACM64Y_01990 [Novispirillum sp. DQ9]|uniref:hypothetical protein n=1 Tax=Novispirillum sp. DQ9 TaxID=3398612 RepID=UPI003C7CDB30